MNIGSHVTSDMSYRLGMMRAVQKCNKKGIMPSNVTAKNLEADCRLNGQVTSRGDLNAFRRLTKIRRAFPTSTSGVLTKHKIIYNAVNINIRI